MNTDNLQPRKIIMCLDGTWNSTYAKAIRADGTDVAKPSNVLKLARAVRPVAADGTSQIVYYDAGIGGDVDSEGGWKIFTDFRKTKEGMWGLGFNANVEQALTFLVNNFQHESHDEVFFYGFSRGAATARAIVKFIDWMKGIPTKRDAFYIPEFFEAYRKSKGKRTCERVMKERGSYIQRNGKKRPRFEPFQPITIKLLGVWDTVYALGSQTTNIAKGAFHVDKIPPAIVQNAYHALALDESRGSFAPAIWSGKHDHQNMVQMWFPGVHSNIGGGYVRDGMANVALHWLARISVSHGLDLDQDFLDFYRPYERDRLYKSKSLGYTVMDRVLSKKSGRNFLRLPDSAHQSFHPAILARMLATKAELGLSGEHKGADYETGLYEPESIWEMLDRVEDPQAYCRAWSDDEWFVGQRFPLDSVRLRRLNNLIKRRQSNKGFR